MCHLSRVRLAKSRMFVFCAACIVVVLVLPGILTCQVSERAKQHGLFEMLLLDSVLRLYFDTLV